MVLTKEYRICMPLTVEEYQIGQLYMIARHSHEQTDSGEGVEVIENVACEDPEHGKGQYTEKRIHLSSRLPYWIQSFIPKLFYITEKAWNYYPYTLTVFVFPVHMFIITDHKGARDNCPCSFLPKFNISIKTKYENNNGTTENCLNVNPESLMDRSVEFIDIAYDEVNPKHYKEEEDVRYFQSQKTGRGPLVEGWRDTTVPIMCSYKLVQVSFEVWGLQTKVEDLIHRAIREILLLGHRQAFAWIDEWYGMSLADVRAYEKHMQNETNTKVAALQVNGDEVPGQSKSKEEEEEEEEKEEEEEEGEGKETKKKEKDGKEASSTAPQTPCTPKSPKSWFSWS